MNIHRRGIACIVIGAVLIVGAAGIFGAWQFYQSVQSSIHDPAFRAGIAIPDIPLQAVQELQQHVQSAPELPDPPDDTSIPPETPDIETESGPSPVVREPYIAR